MSRRLRHSGSLAFSLSLGGLPARQFYERKGPGLRHPLLGGVAEGRGGYPQARSHRRTHPAATRHPSQEGIFYSPPLGLHASAQLSCREPLVGEGQGEGALPEFLFDLRSWLFAVYPSTGCMTWVAKSFISSSPPVMQTWLMPNSFIFRTRS